MTPEDLRRAYAKLDRQWDVLFWVWGLCGGLLLAAYLLGLAVACGAR